MPGPGRVVVVGGGVAAPRLVEVLRAGGATGDVVVLCEEPLPPYDRPPLSKQVLRGEREVGALCSPGQWAAWGVELRLGARAVALDPVGRTVRLSDGELVAYDEVVLATGAEPRTLPALRGDGVHVLRSAAQAAALREAVLSAGRLTVVGGGFLGCEVASSLRSMGVEVVLLELLPLPLVRVLGSVVSKELVPLHEQAGVDLRLGTSLREVQGDGAARRLLLSDGTAVAGDVVLVAAGVEPATGWLQGSGVDVSGGGVLCDASGRTSRPHVWAVGDVSTWDLPRAAGPRRVEHWTNARQQAEVVARNLLVPPGGEVVRHDPVPYVWSDQFGLKLQVVGLPAHDDDVTVMHVGTKGDRLLAVYGREGRLTGAFGGGAAKHVIALQRLLEQGAAYEDALVAAAAA